MHVLASVSSAFSRARLLLVAPVLLAVVALLALAPRAQAAPTATGPSGTYAAGDAQINTATPPATQSWLVKNTGTDLVWVVSSTLGGTDPDQFLLAGTCAERGESKPLAANETCTVVVGLLPTGTGPKSTVLTTVTNGPIFTTEVCQLVSPLDNDDGTARVQVFGRGRSYDAEGVHAPN